MNEPVYFVVERGPSGETPAIYYNILPDRLTRKIPRDDRGQACGRAPIIYALRLDTLPGASRWIDELIKRPLAEIYAEYCRRRDGNELPPTNLAGAQRKAAVARLAIGDFWEPPARIWEDRPADPFPVPGTLRPKLDAPGYIA